VTVPKTADVETYRTKIEELFEATRTHFIETASNSPHVDFEQYISMLTTDLFVEVPAKKGGKGKNASRASLAFDGEQVSALLTQWPVQDAVQPLVVFNRKVEEKVSRLCAFYVGSGTLYHCSDARLLTPCKKHLHSYTHLASCLYVKNRCCRYRSRWANTSLRTTTP
jgi:hypothetical protein